MSRVSALVLFVVLVAGGVLAVPTARSASPDIVVSQVYAGGGNAGASFTHDYVELFNRGSTTIDLSTWTIQYASAAGTTWQATALTGSIAPGRYYLVQLASAAAVGSPLPTPDATGTTNLAVSGGKVAVVRDSTPLACGASPGSCSAVTSIADLIGYGTAADHEGSGAAPALGNTTAAVRAGDGCTDADANPTDFAADTPAPRNSSAAATTCGVEPPPTGGVSQSATVDVDIQPVLSIALERRCRQLRERDDRCHTGARLGARHRRQQQRRRVRADRPSHGLPAGRPSPRHRGHRSERGTDRRLARRRRHGRHPDRVRPPTCWWGPRPLRAPAPGTSGTRASASCRPFQWSRPGGTPRPSPSR